uniref:Uncharacterized protein n=1 Tax=Eutreptiella gymnastica TaxID=73025 RepID=A0A7S4FZA1_9EUGL
MQQREQTGCAIWNGRGANWTHAASWSRHRARGRGHPKVLLDPEGSPVQHAFWIGRASLADVRHTLGIALASALASALARAPCPGTSTSCPVLGHPQRKDSPGHGPPPSVAKHQSQAVACGNGEVGGTREHHRKERRWTGGIKKARGGESIRFADVPDTQ